MHKIKNLIYLNKFYKNQYQNKLINKKQWLYNYQNIFLGLGKLFLIGMVLSALNALVSFSDMLMLINFANHYGSFDQLFANLHVSATEMYVLAKQYHLPFYDIESIIRSATALISGLGGLLYVLPLLLFTGFGVKYGQYTSKNNFSELTRLCKVTFFYNFILVLCGVMLGLILINFWIPHEVEVTKITITNQDIRNLFTRYEALATHYIIHFAQLFMYVSLAAILPMIFTTFLNKILLLEGAITKNVIIDVLMIIFNIAIDFCLIYFTNLGIVAVACGTVLARVLQFLIAILFFEFNKHNTIKIKDIYQTKLTRQDYKQFFHLAYFGLAMLFSMAGASVYETLSIYFLSYVCVRLNISGIYYLSLFGAVLPIVNFFSSTIVGGRPKVTGYFSFSSANNNWTRFKTAYFTLTFYSMLFSLSIYFILSFLCYGPILKAFKVNVNNDAIILLRLQLCMILSLIFAIPTRPVFDNTHRIGLDLFLQLLRRYGFSILFLILFALFSNSIWTFFSNVCYSSLLGGLLSYSFSFIFIMYYCENKKRKLSLCFPFSLLHYKDYKINKLLKKMN